MVIRRLIVVSSLSLAIVDAGQVFAQAAFPAPVPGQAEAPVSRALPIPHVKAAASTADTSATFPSGSANDGCENGFLPLREEAEKRSKLIKAASERRAPPDEACKLIGDFGQVEIRMIKYIEANASWCGIPPQTAEQLKKSRGNTEKLQKQVCTMAQRYPSGGPDKILGPGDFWIVR